MALEERYEIIRDIGDGSFGSVALARVRGPAAQSNVARRGTLVAVKTMKKTFDSFAPCLELREVVFLRTLPHHIHLVPALDIFLDHSTRKLHIVMEYMDGNLYQLMKARDHKLLDDRSLKSILFQIMSGLEHIHAHGFFHRDIKPENILVSTSGPHESGNAFKRYSAMMTPPLTPPAYSVRIADFGLARDMNSDSPYTTYVSTRWYRAPEVLLRAGDYSAPVDIWAVGAMAVEIATLKPLFPGSNEVDQVWRICEVMGSPGVWVNDHGRLAGGGEWGDGVALAQKLGFSFPKMTPHTIEAVLPTPQWPPSLSHFISWCLMWDPGARPTSTQALRHGYFTDAVDPLLPKSSGSRMLARKRSQLGLSSRDASEETLSSRTSSWFRRSLVARESAPAVPQFPVQRPPSPSPSPVGDGVRAPAQQRPTVPQRATWAQGMPANAAPMPILPSMRPASPLHDAAMAETSTRHANPGKRVTRKKSRQLSLASLGNHYSDLARSDADQNGQSSLQNGKKEGFFSHMRKRARRISGRQYSNSSLTDVVDNNAGCAPWHGQKPSMVLDVPVPGFTAPQDHPYFAALDQALEKVRCSLELPHQFGESTMSAKPSMGSLKRCPSLPFPTGDRASENLSPESGPISSRTRQAAQRVPEPQCDTPDEEDLLLGEALASAHFAIGRLNRGSYSNTPKPASPVKERYHPQELQHPKAYPRPQANPRPREYPRPPLQQAVAESRRPAALSTAAHSANNNNVLFPGLQSSFQSYILSETKPLNIIKKPAKEHVYPVWPTPPDEMETDWAKSAMASVFAAGAASAST